MKYFHNYPCHVSIVTTSFHKCIADPLVIRVYFNRWEPSLFLIWFLLFNFSTLYLAAPTTFYCGKLLSIATLEHIPKINIILLEWYKYSCNIRFITKYLVMSKKITHCGSILNDIFLYNLNIWSINCKSLYK